MTATLVRRSSTFVLVTSLLCASSVLAKDRLIVLELSPGADVSQAEAAGFTEAVALAAAQPGFYEVISTKELQALLGVERQRQLMGCTDDTRCATELTNAMGARYLLQGSLGRLGASFQISLQLVDSRQAKTLSRSARIAPTLEALRRRLLFCVAEATGLPPPPPPSPVPAIASITGGALLLLGSGAVAAAALVEDDALTREQQRGIEGTLGTRATYAAAQQRLFLQKTGALAAAVAGAGLVGLGLLLVPQNPDHEGFALLIGPSSVGFAAVFP